MAKRKQDPKRLRARSDSLTNANKNNPWVKRYLEGNTLSIPDPYNPGSGKTSSHGLSYHPLSDSTAMVYPEIVQQGDSLVKLGNDAAREYAIKNNTGITTDLELAKFYSENGLIDHTKFAKGGQVMNKKQVPQYGMGGDIMMGVGTGAMGGAGLGPWGAVGGAVLGGIGGFLGSEDRAANQADPIQYSYSSANARNNYRPTFEMGGMTSFQNVPVELENDEVFRKPNDSKIYEVDGKYHSQGGEPYRLPEGTEVLGKTINPITGNMFKKDGMRLKKAQDKMYSNKGIPGTIGARTNERKIKQIQQEYTGLFEGQEKLKYGGRVSNKMPDDGKTGPTKLPIGYRGITTTGEVYGELDFPLAKLFIKDPRTSGLDARGKETFAVGKRELAKYYTKKNPEKEARLLKEADEIDAYLRTRPKMGDKYVDVDAISYKDGGTVKMGGGGLAAANFFNDMYGQLYPAMQGEQATVYGQALTNDPNINMEGWMNDFTLGNNDPSKQGLLGNTFGIQSNTTTPSINLAGAGVQGAVPSSKGAGLSFGQNVQRGWNNAGGASNILGTAARLAPVAYNLIQGMGKRDQLKASDYYNPQRDQVMNLMANRKYNINPILQSNKTAAAVGRYNLKGANAGQQYAGIQGLAAAEMRANEGAWATKINKENDYAAQEAQMKYGVGQGMANTNLNVAAMNQQSDAAGRSYLGQGFGDLSEYAQVQQQMANQKEISAILAGIYPDMFGTVLPYMSGTQRAINKYS